MGIDRAIRDEIADNIQHSTPQDQYRLSQLERISNLHQSGQLTNEEFEDIQSKKRRLYTREFKL